MMRAMAIVLAMFMVGAVVTEVSALVLCGKGKGGVAKEGTPLKVRTACTGKEVLGGGASVFAFSSWVTEPDLRYSRPVTTDPQGWTAGTSPGQNNDDWYVQVWAICANVAP